MKSFRIEEVLIYNPNARSKKKKPIESDIQQAKIMAFYPKETPIQQKWNCVGMAEGVYEFCNSLLPQQARTVSTQIIFMDECCLVQKQFEESIWIFIKVGFAPQQKYKQKKRQEQTQIQIQTGYINNELTEDVLQEFINHFYQSFQLFYGKINAFLFLDNLMLLQNILNYFIPKYEHINSYPYKQDRLYIISYLIKTIRAIPCDVNTTLKFQYFKNVLQSYQPNIIDIIVFSHGYLAYSSLNKTITQFFATYLFGLIEPLKFQHQKINQRFRILNQSTFLNNHQKYGTIFNSAVLGVKDSQKRSGIQDPRSSISTPNKAEQNSDLLGLEQKQSIELMDVYLTKNGQQIKCKLNFFFQKSMIYLTFYRKLQTQKQLIFANRFFHDNSHKFQLKINQTLGNLQNSSDIYRFLFVNDSTFVGKCTFKDWSLVSTQVKYTLAKIKKSTEGQICTTFLNHWIYGIKRMNRILILLIPNQIPLHKLDQFTAKMTKQYFYNCFM